jgi:large subunit ribosomal protein L25
MSSIKLSAEPRQNLGGSHAEQLRRQGRVPGVIYGHGEPTTTFHVKELDLRPLIYTQETHTIDFTLGGKSSRAILREVQFHPVTDRVRHIDLVVLHADEKVKVEVPFVMKGSAPGQRDGGILDITLHKVTVEALPDSLPEHIDVDISNLKMGQSIHVNELPEHPGFKILGDEAAVIVACHHPKNAAEETPAAGDAIAEPEQIQAKGKKDEAA